MSSFESNVCGTRNIIDLARSSRYASKVRLVFASSVASVQSWDKRKGNVPEEVIQDATYAVGGGYGEGKYVAERVRCLPLMQMIPSSPSVPQVLARSGIESTSLRIGQVSGGLPNGAWATSDWVPILLKSSMTLGVLPDLLGASITYLFWIMIQLITHPASFRLFHGFP